MGVNELPAEKKREVLSKLKDLLSQSDSDTEICESLNISYKDFEKLKTEFYYSEGAQLKERSNEEHYLEYILDQNKNIQVLNTVIDKEIKRDKLSPIIVNAVKVRADLRDKIIAKGQEFGIIAKTPERKEIIGGIIIAQLTDDELREKISKELSLSLLDKYGGAQQSIIDIDPGQIHYELPTNTEQLVQQEFNDISKIDTPLELYNNSKSKNKVHKGRRVVKKKVNA